VNRNLRTTFIAGLFSLVVSVVLASLLASALTKPIGMIAAELEDIGHFAISERPAPRSFLHEVVVMADALDHMKSGLRSFERYVPVDVVRALLADGKRAELGGELREVSILFSDIAGFTTLVESTPPNVVVDALGEYFGDMGAAVSGNDGVIASYIGDAIMALWGAPTSRADHAMRACHTALQMRDASRQLLSAFEARGLPPMATRIGVNTGECVVGNIGAPTRFGYTGVGDAVNTSARLEGLNKAYRTEILLGEATVAQIGDAFVVRELDRVRLKGKGLPITVYELVAEVGECDESSEQLLAAYASGLAAYFQRDFAGARHAFERVVAIDPHDGPGAVMLARCSAYLDAPPPADWDGVFEMTSK
jgi:adenylate cyclase